MTSGPVFEIRARRGHPDFLDLPWGEPLHAWATPRLIRMAHGVSRHVVRFVSYGERVYALKATEEAAARREYELLRELADENLPVVEAVGVVTSRRDAAGDALPAVLVTRYLDFSLPYRYLYGSDDARAVRPKLVDAGVVLLVRLHLDGFFWGDCSLNNILFRRDAGAMMAYLVDAETGERRPSLADAMRLHDVEIARVNIAGDLSDLVASGRLPDDTDVAAIVDAVEERYHSLWDELTRTDEFAADDPHCLESRIRRLEDLGFDVDEVTITATDGGRRLRMRPAVVEEGHHARELERLTGLVVQENQARRFLADIASWEAYLNETEPVPVPRALAAVRWRHEVYEPRSAAVPADLRDRLEPAEMFHQLLEHRWFRSEQEGSTLTTDAVWPSFLDEVLARRPAERLVVDTPDGRSGVEDGVGVLDVDAEDELQ